VTQHPSPRRNDKPGPGPDPNERVNDKARNFERVGLLAREDPILRIGKTLRSTPAASRTRDGEKLERGRTAETRSSGRSEGNPGEGKAQEGIGRAGRLSAARPQRILQGSKALKRSFGHRRLAREGEAREQPQEGSGRREAGTAPGEANPLKGEAWTCKRDGTSPQGGWGANRREVAKT